MSGWCWWHPSFFSPARFGPQKAPEQEITFSSFKEVLVNAGNDHQQETRRRLNLINSLKTTKFEDLVDSYQSPVGQPFHFRSDNLV